MVIIRRLIALLRRSKSSRDGQALIEFALVIPIVLFVFLGIFDFGRFYFTRLTLQHAVSEAARFAVTGKVLPDPEGNPMSRVQSMIAVISKQARALDVDVERVTIDPGDGGGPGDVVSISAEFTFQFIVPLLSALVPDGEVEFRVSTAMKNEPFLVSQGP
jgi:hypothetical protein